MGPRNALIIDDNEANLGILARLLSRQGVDSVSVLNPNELDQILQELDKVDVAFVDLELPNVNGYDILEKLKSDPRFENVPVVAYTVHLSEINVAHNHGFDSFLSKPLDANKFPEQLEKILSGESVWSTR